MSNQIEAIKRIGCLSDDLSKDSTREQVEWWLPFMRMSLCFTKIIIRLVHGVDLDNIKDDKYRVRNLIRDVHTDEDYINLEFYLLDKYDLWDKYLEVK